MRQSHKTIILWVFLFLLFYVIYSLVNHEPDEVKDISFSAFNEQIEQGIVDDLEIRIVDGNEFGSEYSWKTKDGKFKSTGYFSDEVATRLNGHKVAFTIKPEKESSFWQTFLVSWLPMILLLLIFFVFMRQIQNGGGKAMSFGKSRARLLNETQDKVTFEDVAGIEEAKEELEEIIEFLRDPKRFTRLGGRIPKGVLLMGQPGTGKTLLARAIAGEAGVPFFTISGSDFVEMFVGVGASRVRDLFEQGKKHAPCIVFIDEIDAVGRHRGAGLGGGHDEREQTLNQLLVEMDGFESNEGVILIAATNRPDVLDPALLRPGRFDRRVTVPLPDIAGRELILAVHTRRVPMADDVGLDLLARGTPGFSGADIENLVNEAALIGARRNRNKVEMIDFEDAKDKVLMGTERKSMIISDKEKVTTAYHEGGHALVSILLPMADPLHKVSIIPRGIALGITQQLPIEDRHNYARGYAEDRIAISLAGRIAEELVLNEQTTGASNDLTQSTELAHKMVCEWGMSKKLGPLTYGHNNETIFLGKDFARRQEMSEHTAQLVDDEVRRIVSEQYDRAKGLLESHLGELRAIAEALLEYETIEGEEVEALIEGKRLTRRPPEHRLKNAPPVQKRRTVSGTDNAAGSVMPPMMDEPSKA